MEYAHPGHLVGELGARQRVIRSEDIDLPADDTVDYELLHKLMSSGGDD